MGTGMGSSALPDAQGVSYWSHSLTAGPSSSVARQRNPALSPFHSGRSTGLVLGGPGADITEGLNALLALSSAGATAHIHVPQEEDKLTEFFDRRAHDLSNQPLRVVFVVGTKGDTWTSPNAAAETVGLAPLRYRAEREVFFNQVIDRVGELRRRGVDVFAVNGHVGTASGLTGENKAHFIQTIQRLCDRCETAGINFGVETGPDSSEALLDFISSVDRQRLVINFNPANMVFYGSDTPLRALKALMPHLGSIHVKNAAMHASALTDGSEWRGSEVDPTDSVGAATELAGCLRYFYAYYKLSSQRSNSTAGAPTDFLAPSLVVENEFSPEGEKLGAMVRTLTRVRHLFATMAGLSTEELRHLL